jgi:hypothetical protein
MCTAAEPPRREEKSPHEVLRVHITEETTMFVAEVRLEGEAVKNSLGSRTASDEFVEPEIIKDSTAGR